MHFKFKKKNNRRYLVAFSEAKIVVNSIHAQQSTGINDLEYGILD